MTNGHPPKFRQTPVRPLGLVLLVVLLVALSVGGGMAIGRSSGRHGGDQQAASPSPTAATTTSTTLAPTTTAHGASSATTITALSTTTATRTVPTTTEDPGSVLAQALARPDRVASLMDVDTGGAGGLTCGEISEEIHEPTVVLSVVRPFSVTTVEWISRLDTCLVGFAHDAPIDVTIDVPGGKTKHRRASPCDQDCPPSVVWAVMPGDPLGDYAITAVQGNLRATGVVHMRSTSPPHARAPERSLMVVTDSGVPDVNGRVTVRPGTTIVIVIVGFQPRQLVDLVFYYTREGPQQLYPRGLRFKTYVLVKTDLLGNAIYRLQTSPRDPPGCYIVHTWPTLPNHYNGITQHQNTTYGAEQFCLAN
jgi:hypothetical protein